MPIRKKPISRDTIIAIAATITSVCALIVTVYQTKLTREQQLNSVWPYLIIYDVVDENQQASLMVSNYGIGPAIIDSVRVTYKERSYSSPVDVVKAISKGLNRGEYGMQWFQTSLSKGSVIPQGQTSNWIIVNNPADNAIFRKELSEIKAYIYYHSIYEEHWHSVWHDDSELVIKD